ncbi:MAG TPA: hypothetical protein VNO31_15595, partial [Umezawaea sp.]|nr:hypothetical protein [Umezawaea sp.]
MAEQRPTTGESGPAGKPAGPPAEPTPVEPSAQKSGEGESGKKDDEHGKAETPYGPDRRAFGEAYEMGRALKTDGPMAFVRDATIEDMHVGDQHHYYTARSGAGVVRSGSVHEQELARIRARYVPVIGYESMCDRLKTWSLVVLHGQPGTGRFTTAVRMLDELSRGNVSRFDIGHDIDSLTEQDFQRGRGYVIELAARAGIVLTEAQLGKLRDLLENQACLCVVITEGDDLTGEGLGGHAIPYVPPDESKLLERHISEETEEGVEDILNNLAATPRLRQALGRSPRPVETAHMAKLLAQYGRGDIDIDEVENRAARLVHRQVVEWFGELAGLRKGGPLEEALRLAAFRIALAVLNGSPYHIVAEAGRSLARRFVAVAGTASKSQAPLFSDDQTSRLPKSRAEIVDGFVAFGHVEFPVGLARFSDSRFPVVLLSYVWQHHHNLREALVSWLKKLSKDTRPMVWVRAAQTTGLFCSLDFHFTFN